MEEIQKKKYYKPQIDSFTLDREIALVMMTGETDPGDPPPPQGSPASVSTALSKKKTTSASSFQQNPFNEK